MQTTLDCFNPKRCYLAGAYLLLFLPLAVDWKHKVNEMENMVRPSGWQTQGKRVPTCQLHPWTHRVKGNKRQCLS